MQTLDQRGLSRRGLVRMAGLAGASTAFVAGAAQASAQASGHAKEGAPVFDRKATGKVHVLPSTAQTVRVGTMDPTAPSVLEIESGDVVHYPHTWVNWANEAKFGMSFAEREPIRKKYAAQGPYSLIGPVMVKGAEPGDIIECRMLRLKPIAWGWNSAPKGVGALPADFTEPYLHYLKFDAARTHAEFAPGVTIPLKPLQGVMAVQPAGDQPVSAILSGAYGGNIVLSELVEGTALFLPVQVPGARLWTGDSHAAQGDGVVDQTAIETAMEDLRIQYVLHKKVDLTGPIAETPTHWIVLGFGEDLEAALTASLRQSIAWISAASGLSKIDAYALLSITGSFRITQYAHQTNSNYAAIPAKTVHGMIPKAVFDPAHLQQMSRSLRPES
ncbi:MAG TPA: acetamidase/formamidase family protein [Caulobacteraceae bacterium]